MKVKSSILGYLAAGLLVGAPQAMALNVDAALVVDVDSASGTVEVISDVCMAAISELIVDGFVLQSSSPVGGNGGPDLSAHLFTGNSFGDLQGPDVVTLYCVADINVGGGHNGPGPCGPFGC